MVYLGGTVVGIAMPTIQEHFSATIGRIQWVLNGFAISLAALLLLAGSLSDHFGRKKVFLVGLALYMAGSALSALSATVNQLIASQVFQGIGAALLLTASLAVANASFRPEERGRALGLWGGLSAGIAATGPFFGGWLVDVFGWPSVFYLNVALGAVTFIISAYVLHETRNPEARSMDWFGTLLVILAFVGISYGLIQGPEKGWMTSRTAPALLAGIAAFAGFLWHSAKTKEPMLPLGLFRNPLVAGANIVTLFLYLGLNSLLIFIVFNWQQVQGMTPTQVGLAMLPPILVITFFTGAAGKLTDRIGPRLPMILGPLLTAVGMGLLILPGRNASYLTDFLPALTVWGAGMALTIPALTKSALSVAEKDSGIAAGVSNVVSRTATLLAIAVMGATLITAFSGHLHGGLQQADLEETERQVILDQRTKMAAIEIPASFSPEKQEATRVIIQDAFIRGWRLLMIINLLLSLLAVAVSYLMIQNPKTTKK